MDKTLNLKLKEFKKALATLDEAIAKKETDIVRDAVIKRFEYTFELCWKTVKVYLYANAGIDVFSPKDCFRNLGKNSNFQESGIEKMLEMTNDRNLIVHMYDLRFSKAHYGRIVKKYSTLLSEIYQELTN
jgi:nucleotidyltransferase substrate binding protein (TIGR01987 family)